MLRSAAVLDRSTVLRLVNMTTKEDLTDDKLYEVRQLHFTFFYTCDFYLSHMSQELMEDVSEECNEHGTVRSIVIPRPSFARDDLSSGVGSIFVQFTSEEGCARALNVVHGRSFNGQKVQATFYSASLFEEKSFS